MLVLLSVLSPTFMAQVPIFFQEQIRFPRVKNAWKNEEDSINLLLKSHKIDKMNLQIFIRAFKQEGILEVWVKNKTETKYRKLKSWSICSKSGFL